MSAHVLLVVVIVAHLLPEHLADLLGHSSAAWHYVAYGIEAAALWLIVALTIRTLAVVAVATYGAMEGLQRAACRLALPMDRAPSLQAGQTLCDAVTGLPASMTSLLATMIVVVLADTERRPWRC